MSQIEEQSKTLEKELNEMEITNLSHSGFKTLVIRMLKELTEDGNKIKKTQEEVKVAPSKKKKKSTGKLQWRG